MPVFPASRYTLSSLRQGIRAISNDSVSKSGDSGITDFTAQDTLLSYRTVYPLLLTIAQDTLLSYRTVYPLLLTSACRPVLSYRTIHPFLLTLTLLSPNACVYRKSSLIDNHMPIFLVSTAVTLSLTGVHRQMSLSKESGLDSDITSHTPTEQKLNKHPKDSASSGARPKEVPPLWTKKTAFRKVHSQPLPIG